MTVQISFLGKSRIDSQTGYQTARYRFNDGDVVETAFFGLALACKHKPTRLVLLGTAGSMWDTLVENQVTDDTLEQHRLDLMDAVRNNAVTDAHLVPVASLVQASAGCPVSMRIISYGRNQAEQADILRIMAESVQADRCEDVVLDVTHGLRHLPMLALVAAYYLEHVSKAKVADILYGALEMTDNGITPVLSLRGLLAMMDWVQSLAGFDRDGDYGPFVPLLENAGAPKETVGHLQRAAYAERVFNHELARQNLLAFRPILEAGLPGAAALFTGPLAARLAWVKNSAVHQRLAAIARERLAHGDYVRASIATTSGFLASMVRQGERLSDYATHECIEAEFRVGERGNPGNKDAYEELKRLRNALAHGTPPKDDNIRRILADEGRLRQGLRSLIDQLLPP